MTDLRYTRYRRQKRVRYSGRLLAWLDRQAARLSTTRDVIFALLTGGRSSDMIGEIQGTYPTNTVAPAITGTPTSGQTLTTTNGTWTGSATITYARRWLRDGVVIAGQTGLTYALAGADVGASISVEVTATNDLGSVIKTSNTVGPVAA